MSKSTSPVTIVLALLAIAKAKNLSSFGSRQVGADNGGATAKMAALRKSLMNFWRSSIVMYLSNFGRAKTVFISAKVSAE